MTQNRSKLSRRAFSRCVTLGAVAIPGLARPGAAQDSEKSQPRVSDQTPGKDTPEKPALQPPSESEYLTGLILHRYGDERLDTQAVTGILRDIQGDIARGLTLSRFPLTNADEPAFTFEAWRADEPVQ